MSPLNVLPTSLIQIKATRCLECRNKADHNQPALGFTLAELLITLLILGEIATFTIPKIVTSQQNGQYKASAKEVVAMIAQAHQLYSLNNGITVSTSAQNLTPYMNYVATDSSTTIDLAQTMGNRTCGGAYGCIKLHNGGMLLWTSGDNFVGTNPTNAINFYFDPDGRVTDSTTNGPGKSVSLWLYANGRITSYNNLTSGTVYSGGTVGPNSWADPPWFAW